MNKPRVKCLSAHVYPGAPKDPYLKRNAFYTVLDAEVLTIADDTPYITIQHGSQALTRPRHLFGPILKD